MTDIDTLSGAELDALAGTSVMGWHRGYNGCWAWGERCGNTFMDFSGPSIARWHPSRGEKLNSAAGDVLLKALEEGLLVTMTDHCEQPNLYAVAVGDGDGAVYAMTTAPTLPLALVRAICKAVAK